MTDIEIKRRETNQDELVFCQIISYFPVVRGNLKNAATICTISVVNSFVTFLLLFRLRSFMAYQNLMGYFMPKFGSI